MIYQIFSITKPMIIIYNNIMNYIEEGYIGGVGTDSDKIVLKTITPYFFGQDHGISTGCAKFTKQNLYDAVKNNTNLSYSPYSSAVRYDDIYFNKIYRRKLTGNIAPPVVTP